MARARPGRGRFVHRVGGALALPVALLALGCSGDPTPHHAPAPPGEAPARWTSIEAAILAAQQAEGERHPAFALQRVGGAVVGHHPVQDLQVEIAARERTVRHRGETFTLGAPRVRCQGTLLAPDTDDRGAHDAIHDAPSLMPASAPSATAPDAAPRLSAPNRAELSHRAGTATLQEWFVLGPLGLQQGFTLERDPCAGGGALTVEVPVEGASVSQRGTALALQAGAVRFTYDRAFAEDADGVAVPITLRPSGAGLALDLAAAGARYPLRIDPILATEVARLRPPASGDGAPGDQLGTALALDGDTALVGCWRDDTGSASDAGAVYVLGRAGTGWALTEKLLGAVRDGGENFGYAVALSGDTALVGAHREDATGAADRGTAYVFERTGTAFVRTQALVGSGLVASANFGLAVGLAGNLAVVTAPGAASTAGRAYVYERSGTAFVERGFVTGSDIGAGEGFGNTAAVSGATIAVGAPWESSYRGAVYVYGRSGTTFAQEAKVAPSTAVGGNRFAESLALDGPTLVGGALFVQVGTAVDAGAAWVFTRAGTAWTEQARLTATAPLYQDRFGQGVAVSGDTLLVGAPGREVLGAYDQGEGWVFVRSGTVWSEQARLRATSGVAYDELGAAVALQGDTALLGAPHATVGTHGQQGAVHGFQRAGTTWGEAGGRVTSGEGPYVAHRGDSLAMRGSTVVFGATQEDTTQVATGAAWVFEESGGVWASQGRLTASDGMADDAFGYGVDVSGDTVVVGAPYADVGGQADRGAVYVYARSGSTWSESARLVAATGLAGDHLGLGVAIDGAVVVAGAGDDDVGAVTNQGSVPWWERSGTTWIERPALVAADPSTNAYFGAAVALRAGTLLVGAPGVNTNSGAGYAFVRNGAAFASQGKLQPSDLATGDWTGLSVALDGDTAVLGTPRDDAPTVNQGSAAVFTRSAGTWSFQAKLFHPTPGIDDDFGLAVAVSGDLALVGARFDDVGTESDVGSAHVFLRTGTTWSHQAALASGSTEGGQIFGHSVALVGAAAVVGAPYLNGPEPFGERDEGAVIVYALGSAPGAACLTTADCTGGRLCVDAVCCDRACDAPCEACSVAAGAVVDGTCAFTAGPAASVVAGCSGGQACNGTSASCGACLDDAHCAASEYCAVGGTCQARHATGAACDLAADCRVAGCRACTSGHCVDGVCCDGACDAACATCAAALGAPADGTCGPAPAGTAGPDGACAAPRACNGADQSCATTCQGDDDCAATHYCSAAGACALRLTTGALCDTTAGSFCREDGCRSCATAGGCTNGVCCNQPCTGGCQLCSASTGGVCAARPAGSGGCGAYLCDGLAGQCPTTCASDLGCASGNYCSNGSCVPRLPLGAPCSPGSACASGYCVDGVCCNTPCTSLCQACSAALKAGGVDGECGDARAGLDPRDHCLGAAPATCGLTGACAGDGSCALFPPGTACGATVCSGDSVTGRVCDGAGACTTATTGVACAPYRCAGSACTSPCGADTDCVVGYRCAAGTCVTLRGAGEACALAGECLSGFCADGVCCDAGCTGACEACAESGSVGQCRPVSGAPRGARAPCAGSGVCGGSCDGSTAVACSYPSAGTACDGATCAGDALRPAGACDGAGLCAVPVTVGCAPYTCVAAACATSCVTGAECAAGATCTLQGACTTQGATCKDAYTVVAPDGTEASCAPYRCAAGACQQQCAVDGDCAPGYACAAARCEAAADGGAGAGGTAGTTGTGGAAGTAGIGGSAGAAGRAGTGGNAGTVGTGGAAGTAGTGGDAGTAGTSGGSAGSASGGSAGSASGGSAGAGGGRPPAAAADDGGCGCRAGSRSPGTVAGLAAAAALVVVLRRRARRRPGSSR